jgi:hypothetical protein
MKSVAQVQPALVISLIHHTVPELSLLSLIYGLAQADLIAKTLADTDLFIIVVQVLSKNLSGALLSIGELGALSEIGCFSVLSLSSIRVSELESNDLMVLSFVNTVQKEGNTVHYCDPSLIDCPDGPEDPHQVFRVGRRPHCGQVAHRSLLGQ